VDGATERRQCKQVTQAQSLGLAGAGLLLVLALAVLLPGTVGVSFFDRDEGWYAQVCREMRETGDWLVPRYLGEVWIAKPPLLYWLVLASQRALGVGEWQARLVSVLSMSLSVVLTGAWASRMFGRRVGLLAGSVLITCCLPAVVGKLLLADGLMLACTLVAVTVHWRMAVQGVTHWRSAVYWLAIGLGVLAKGPATLLFAGSLGLALVCTPGRRSWLTDGRWWVWLPVALLAAGPWYAYIATHAGPTLVHQFLWSESFGRILQNSPHGRSTPPGTCLLVSLAGLLPWTPLVPGALVAAFRQRRTDGSGWVLLVWLALPWLVVELMRGKLPHHVLPCYVPLSILLARHLCAVTVVQPTRSRGSLARILSLLGPGIMVVLGLACVVAGAMNWRAPWGSAMLGAGLVVVAGFVVAGWLQGRGPGVPAWAGLIGATVALHLVAGFWLLPAMEPTRLSRRLAETIDRLVQPRDQVILCGYTEPTVHYYLAGRARDAQRSELEEALASASGPVVLAVSARSPDQPENLALRDRLAPDPRDRLAPLVRERMLSGLNWGNMSLETIGVRRITSGAAIGR